jgi:hypothetical protein
VERPGVSPGLSGSSAAAAGFADAPTTLLGFLGGWGPNT